MNGTFLGLSETLKRRSMIHHLVTKQIHTLSNEVNRVTGVASFINLEWSCDSVTYNVLMRVYILQLHLIKGPASPRICQMHCKFNGKFFCYNSTHHDLIYHCSHIALQHICHTPWNIGSNQLVKSWYKLRLKNHQWNWSKFKANRCIDNPIMVILYPECPTWSIKSWIITYWQHWTCIHLPYSVHWGLMEQICVNEFNNHCFK